MKGQKITNGSFKVPVSSACFSFPKLIVFWFYCLSFPFISIRFALVIFLGFQEAVLKSVKRLADEHLDFRESQSVVSTNVLIHFGMRRLAGCFLLEHNVLHKSPLLQPALQLLIHCNYSPAAASWQEPAAFTNKTDINQDMLKFPKKHSGTMMNWGQNQHLCSLVSCYFRRCKEK